MLILGGEFLMSAQGILAPLYAAALRELDVHDFILLEYPLRLANV
jgi:hypothetical protein